MLNNILLVGLGGCAGSILRYLCQYTLNTSYPYGTMAVNLAGCFLMGCFWGLLSKGLNSNLGLFLMTGVCGGFTTFSAFGMDGITLLLNHRYLPFVLYTSISVIIGLLLTFLGFKLFNA